MRQARTDQIDHLLVVILHILLRKAARAAGGQKPLHRICCRLDDIFGSHGAKGWER